MTHNNRLSLAIISLLGLSVGDAFGETFFGPVDIIEERIHSRKLQDGQWLFTDDTVMSIGIYNILAAHQHINQDELAMEFACNYALDTHRGYGGTAHSILRSIGDAQHWRAVSTAVFDGMGSMGNGAAMRSALIGAYFYDDTAKVIEQARLAAEVTHAHGEAIAGAIAIALAASICARQGHLTPQQFFDFIIVNTPDSDIKHKLIKAATLPANYDIRTIVYVLGNGTQLTAQDTVPFALWCAAHNLYNYEESLWTAISALGDRDTIGAIVGSVVVLSAGVDKIPVVWMAQVEKVEESEFYKG